MVSHLQSIKGLNHVVILNDRFGYLSVHLNKYNPTTIADRASQFAAIQHNLTSNNRSKTELIDFMQPVLKIDHMVIHMPKSIDRLRTYLSVYHPYLTTETRFSGGFMTRHFNKSMIHVLQQYFDHVDQTKAHKKARLILAQNPKDFKEEIIQTIDYKGHKLKAYKGVFSSSKIDHATAFLLDHIQIKPEDKEVMDLGCGYGIIGYVVKHQNPNVSLHLVDDDLLAIKSCQITFSDILVHFHYSHSLKTLMIPEMDLIVSNLPFHFGHEIDVSLPHRLIREAYDALKPNGRFITVSNVHLNYSTILNKYFKHVEKVKTNKKFEIIKSIK